MREATDDVGNEQDVVDPRPTRSSAAGRSRRHSSPPWPARRPASPSAARSWATIILLSALEVPSRSRTHSVGGCLRATTDGTIHQQLLLVISQHARLLAQLSDTRNRLPCECQRKSPPSCIPSPAVNSSGFCSGNREFRTSPAPPTASRPRTNQGRSPERSAPALPGNCRATSLRICWIMPLSSHPAVAYSAPAGISAAGRIGPVQRLALPPARPPTPPAPSRACPATAFHAA